MTPAEYARQIDQWFAANHHPFRTANMPPSAWQASFGQGIAPSVAAARIAASLAPNQAGPVPVALPYPIDRANVHRLRTCAQFLRAFGWVWGVGSVLLFIPAGLMFLSGTAAGVLVASAPLGACIVGMVTTVLLFAGAEVLRVIADFHQKYI